MKVFQPNEVILREDFLYPEGALVVDGYTEDGCLLAHAKGGGLQYQIPKEEIPKFETVSKDESIPIFRKTRFSLEGLDEESFEGYSDGSLWNGWEKPIFAFKAAQSVLDALGATWTLQEDKKVLRASLDLGNGIEEVEWEAVLLDLPDGGSVQAYPIGAGSTTWEEEA